MAANNSQIIHTCKACGCALGGEVASHFHHVIPRAFGGEKGPTVELCTNCHNLLHTVALCITGKKPYKHLVDPLHESIRQQIMWLATRVAVAYEVTKDDPNKRVQVGMILTARKAEKLDMLMKVFNVGSRQAAIEKLIDAAYAKNFTR